jgi:DNA primase
LIADDLITEIRERTDIVGLIGEYVDLKQRGANFIGLCPFHNEKTPSFNVRRDRQFFHCFGCQESGDALAFVMRLEGLTFPQAARALADRAGLDVSETDDREDAQRRRERADHERLIAVSEAAATFYVAQLDQHPLRESAHTELAGRGVHAVTAAQFRLGYAPPSWDALSTWLKQKGHALADAEALGLVVQRRDRSGYYDRFRHRLMFPIADLHGRVVAFSGRLLPALAAEHDPRNSSSGTTSPRADEPKYINSPESPLYKKGELLFGLHQARVEIRRNGWAILCEGNFDLVALHQAGLRQAVAPLGTAFTVVQAKLLRRFAQRVTLMFDADQAGRKAVHAAYSLIRKADLVARVVALPAGADPDSYLRTHGAESLQRLVDGASGIVEHLIDATADRAGATAAERADALASLGPVLMEVGNPVEIELYVERIAQRFAISDQRVVRQQLRRGVHTGANEHARRRETPQPVSTTKVAPRSGHVKLPQLQSELLGVLLDKPALFQSQYAAHVKELLTLAELQSIFSAAAVQVEDRGSLEAARLLSELEGRTSIEANEWLRERLSVETYSDDAQAEEVLRRGIPILAKQNIECELPQLARRAQLARQRGDETEAMTLTRQHIELSMHAHQLVKGVKR